MPPSEKSVHRRTGYNDIGLRLLHRLYGVEHLHYGLFGGKLKPTLANVPAAQQAYVRLLLSFIPRGVRKIFDVGCGTGGVAAELVKKRHAVTCIAPDPYLVGLTEKRTLGRVRTITDFYENIDESDQEGTFDLILMSESCQYIRPDIGWRNHSRFLRPGGYILVADFFKVKPPDERNPSKSGQPLDDFLRRAGEAGFRVKRRSDITARVAPTMDIYQDIILGRVFPVAEAIAQVVARGYPRTYRLLRGLFGTRIERIRDKYSKQGADLFREYKRYLILLLQKA